ncbi:unnamed protein product [Brassicogethes aeneus]|uniref:Uncharacterized protein n=1 Tax=Brassicogethes aeneus TaxID=1431903 RepID=A0A9P0B8D1_BRAAE|nr:unnamed protein product [Brassicogethes aeneus]
MDDSVPKKTFKLIRRKPVIKSEPEPDVIQKNLEPLFHNIKKKRLAQDIYYQNHSFGVTSLKKDVHQRLGQTSKSQKFFHMPYGTNTSSIGPKPKKLFRRNHQNNQLQRHFSVQDRLNKIRLHQSLIGKNKVLKLGRNIPYNLRVQVSNLDFKKQPNFHRKFKLILNPQLQEDIQAIQLKFLSMPLHLEDWRTQPESTGVRMNDRFTLY